MPGPVGRMSGSMEHGQGWVGWPAWIAEQRGCIPPVPCGVEAGPNDCDLPCDCAAFVDVARAAYRLGVGDARSQVVAAINTQEKVGYVESGGLALACEVIASLPRPEDVDRG